MGRIGDSVPYAQAIRGALTRLANHSAIGAAPRLNAFLSFIVERALAGDAKSLKAYTIAVGALGRHKDFNPATDAIVRVEAGRLREALARYYANEGATDPVIISIPRGSYVPRFAWNDYREARIAAATELANPAATGAREGMRLLADGYQARVTLARSIEASRRTRTLLNELLEECRREKALLEQCLMDLRTLVALTGTIMAESGAERVGAQSGPAVETHEPPQTTADRAQLSNAVPWLGHERNNPIARRVVGLARTSESPDQPHRKAGGLPN